MAQCVCSLSLVCLIIAEAKGSICRRLRPLRLCVSLCRLASHDVSACSSPFMEGVSYVCLCCSCASVSVGACGSPSDIGGSGSVVVVVVAWVGVVIVGVVVEWW